MKGRKLSLKHILLGVFLLVVVIPSITILREIGIANNLSQISFNPFAAFVEMGMQIRTTVYTLDDIKNHQISLLWGESYWRPITNMFPIFDYQVATGFMKSKYPGYGYNQVAESYLNFRSLGVALYFGFVSYILTSFESKNYSLHKLAYMGCVTSILINATRNYFAFVPGQVLLVTILYYIVKKSSKY